MYDRISTCKQTHTHVHRGEWEQCELYARVRERIVQCRFDVLMHKEARGNRVGDHNHLEHKKKKRRLSNVQWIENCAVHASKRFKRWEVYVTLWCSFIFFTSRCPFVDSSNQRGGAPAPYFWYTCLRLVFNLSHTRTWRYKDAPTFFSPLPLGFSANVLDNCCS